MASGIIKIRVDILQNQYYDVFVEVCSVLNKSIRSHLFHISSQTIR